MCSAKQSFRCAETSAAPGRSTRMPSQIACSSQHESERVLGTRVAVDPLGAGPGSGRVQHPRLHELLDPGEGELHPAGRGRRQEFLQPLWIAGVGPDETLGLRAFDEVSSAPSDRVDDAGFGEGGNRDLGTCH
jgi:hypothetical protein